MFLWTTTGIMWWHARCMYQVFTLTFVYGLLFRDVLAGRFPLFIFALKRKKKC